MNFLTMGASYLASSAVFVATFVAVYVVYRKRLEAGFLWIILSLVCKLALGLIAGRTALALLSPLTFAALGHLPAILALVGWILLARAKPPKLAQTA